MRVAMTIRKIGHDYWPRKRRQAFAEP